MGGVLKHFQNNFKILYCGGGGGDDVGKLVWNLGQCILIIKIIKYSVYCLWVGISTLFPTYLPIIYKSVYQ